MIKCLTLEQARKSVGRRVAYVPLYPYIVDSYAGGPITQVTNTCVLVKTNDSESILGRPFAAESLLFEEDHQLVREERERLNILRESR